MKVRAQGAVVLAAVVGILAVGCGGSEPRPPRPAGADRPYVVSAVDYHFHDAHPSQPIALDRELIVRNHGSNIHNVTIRGTSYDQNVGPGKELRIKAVSQLVSEPGRYPFVCKFHVDRGMGGVLVVIPAET